MIVVGLGAAAVGLWRRCSLSLSLFLFFCCKYPYLIYLDLISQLRPLSLSLISPLVQTLQYIIINLFPLFRLVSFVCFTLSLSEILFELILLLVLNEIHRGGQVLSLHGCPRGDTRRTHTEKTHIVVGVRERRSRGRKRDWREPRRE